MAIENKLITIVTVVYNEVESISNTIESIIKHLSSEIEYIVIDGGSSDGTLSVINRYKESIDLVISEPDNGIYDAMNKGIINAKGHYLININCGDILLCNPIDFLNKNSILNKIYDLILFNVLQSNGVKFVSKASNSLKFHNSIHHQGAMYKVDKNELYDLRFKVFSDFDFNQRIFKKKPNVLKKDITLVKHDLNGISHSKFFFYENNIIINDNFGFFYTVISFFYFKKQGFIRRVMKNAR